MNCDRCGSSLTVYAGRWRGAIRRRYTRCSGCGLHDWHESGAKRRKTRLSTKAIVSRFQEINGGYNGDHD